MDNNNTIDANEIIRKRDRLTQAAIILKKEFFGIDSVIDQVIESVSSWYFFPYLQERPVVVNLWGMTGVGKSNLLERLVQLLNLNDQYFHFDMSEIAEGQANLSQEFSLAYQVMNKKPIIMAFDEFQLSRSIDEDNKEANKNKTRIVWDIIDSGKYKFINYSYSIQYLHEFMTKANYLIKSGLKVRNGIVVRGKTAFLEEFNVNKESTASKRYSILNKRKLFRKPESLKKPEKNESVLYFVDKDILDILFELYNDKITRISELQELLLQLNENETLEFIRKVLNYALCPKVVDLSKSLVFIIGNLDEAYKMSGDFNPDIDADSFFEATQKIGVTEIKTALKKRFRKEQISRLGNTHIIYPSLNSKAFRNIIIHELKKIEIQWINRFKSKINFDCSVINLLYAESVFPTQGARPVLSTINQLIRSKLGHIVVETYNKEISGFFTIEWCFENKLFSLKFIQEGKMIHEFKMHVNLSLNERRKPLKNDLHSVVAVHESGHAVISIVLLNIIPDKVVSITASDNSLGFNYTNLDNKIHFKDEMVNWIALYLGGIVAEELVFGEDKISSGSSEDIVKATEFASHMIKNSGMFKLPISVQVEGPGTNHYFFDKNGEYNKQLEVIIQSGKQKALDILNSNMALLLAMANYLSDHSVLNKSQIQKLVDQFAHNDGTENEISLREILKAKFNKIGFLQQENNKALLNGHISLNKETY